MMLPMHIFVILIFISCVDMKVILAMFRSRLFMLTTIVPTVVAIFYFTLIASDGYVSVSKFVVRAQERPSANPLGQLLKTTGFSKALDDAYAVQEFITSRDALAIIEEKANFRSIYHRYGFDILNLFPGVWGDVTQESLYQFYLNKIYIDTDISTSVTALQVTAPTPEAAKSINEMLLLASENLVNRLNERGRQDTVKIALDDVERVEAEAKEANAKLATYRNQKSIIDPDRQSTINLQQIAKLEENLIQARVQLSQVTMAAPQNPQIGILKKQITELEETIQQERERVAGSRGRSSLATKSAEFQELIFENSLAEKKLAAALTSLETAKSEAAKKHIYIERVVEPNVPDLPMYPRRIRGILATLAGGLLAWGILSLLTASVKEHLD